jgi:hypothetical protein
MVDIKVFVTYEVWKDRTIKQFTKTDVLSVETDTDSINNLVNQIRYYFKDDVKEPNIYNWKVNIIEIVTGKLDNFTLEDLNKLEILL